VTDLTDVLRRSYEAFNRRDIDAATASMDADVDWPDMLEGRRVRGRQAVREYWLAQFDAIDPHVEPVAFERRDNGEIAAHVHQVVRSKDGDVMSDQMVEHVYTFRDGLVVAMDVYVNGELASAPRGQL
jgi:ketosteroid isomerase-like protein